MKKCFITFAPLIIEIASYLSAKDLCRLSQVCQRIRTIVDLASPAWKQALMNFGDKPSEIIKQMAKNEHAKTRKSHCIQKQECKLMQRVQKNFANGRFQVSIL
jgi:hypothetical protein